MKKNIKFNDAIKLVSDFFEKNNDEVFEDFVALRDVRGRFRILANVDEVTADVALSINALGDALKTYAAKPFLQTRNELFDPDSIFKSKDLTSFSLSENSKSFKLMDRTITGAGWSAIGSELSNKLSNTPKLAFFGLKGGVGRSTALTILAYELARVGKNVMLIDLDIESPGLSSLILPEESKLPFGVVDWVIESTSLEDVSNLLDDIVCDSPLSLNLPGYIKVVPAVGNDNEFYLDKLSRVYSESKDGDFNSKLISLVENVTEKYSPDILLIDSRSGLHDIAALSIVSLADNTLLFGIDSAQSWQGYEMLFSFWNSRADVARHVRDKLKIVQSLMPELDQINRANVFRQKSHTLFSNYLYDSIEPSVVDGDVEYEMEKFSFDESDDAAPHYPIRIMWSNRFQEFQPLLIETGIVSPESLRMCFGELIDWVSTNFNLTEERS